MPVGGYGPAVAGPGPGPGPQPAPAAKGWGAADIDKLKATLKDLKLSDAEIDQLMADAKAAGETAAGLNDFAVDPVKSGKLTGKKAKDALDTYLKKLKASSKESRLPMPATLIVILPENASLKVEGAPTQARTGRRVFVSPPLSVGKSYVYHLEAVYVVEGRMVVATRSIPIEAGQEAEVTFETNPVAVENP